MMRQDNVIIEQGSTSYGAYVPDLPQCVAVAEMEGEARQLIHEAIGLHVESLQEEGQPVPKPRSHSEVGAVATTEKGGLVWY